MKGNTNPDIGLHKTGRSMVMASLNNVLNYRSGKFSVTDQKINILGSVGYIICCQYLALL